jgi:hypothetical protein
VDAQGPGVGGSVGSVDDRCDDRVDGCDDDDGRC